MLKGPGRTARSQVGHGRNGSDSGTVLWSGWLLLALGHSKFVFAD